MRKVALLALTAFCSLPSVQSVFASPQSERSAVSTIDLYKLSVNRTMHTQIDLGESRDCSATRSDAFPTGDLFEIPTRIVPRPNHPSPEKRGQCLDLSEFRPAIALLPEEDAAWNFPIERSRITVANVRGVAGFYVASIPVDSAEWIHYQIYDSRPLPVGGHSEVAVHFSEPVILHPQFPPSNTKTILVHDLILSLQGVSSEGADFVPGSYDGSYISSVGMSLPEFKVKRMFKEKSKVSSYQINVSQPALGQYLREYVKLATTTRLHTVYNVSGNKNFFYDDSTFNLVVNGSVVDVFGDTGGNCVTVHMMLFDKIFGKNYSSEQKSNIGKELLSYFDPQHALMGLQHRGLIVSAEESALGDWSKMPDIAKIIVQLENGESEFLP